MKKQQQKSLQTKMDIMAAARALFTEKGYMDTSINDIVQRSGYSIGAFYGHFNSKQELATIIWKDIMIGAISESVEKGSAITDKDAFIEYLVEHAQSVSRIALLDTLDRFTHITTEIQNEIQQYATRYLCMIRDAIKIWNPSLSEDLTWSCASAIHCLINSYAQRNRSAYYVHITEDGLKTIINKLVGFES